MKEDLLLLMLSAYKGERTIYGAQHILQGKKSAQAIQDGHFFSLLPYFHLFPSITREEVEKLALTLQQRKWIVLSDDHRAILTSEGEAKVRFLKNEYDFVDRLDGWKYLKLTEVFWLRLTLYIQTLTQLHLKQKAFIPITSNRDIQKWVKRKLQLKNQQHQTELDALYHDLRSFLETCSELEARIFVGQLSSPSQIGLTLFQLADQLQLNTDYIYVVHRATLHKLFDELLNDKHQALRPFIGGLQEHQFLTETAKKTANLLRQGLSIDEIVIKRRLKRNTIEDHVVELALYDPTFSIHPYLTKQEYHRIIEAAEALNTLKLKQLREYVGDSFSYFMIRIALTRKDSSYEPA
ncbi:helix-turn-helix domain-containing protein [Bacillus gibsonii]|uniref:helix-turn-helix domain-containing protein n=2 Tax=Alkalicoccobacillus gibsonii TaxID=79881 RepID=UPI0019336AB3|nr:helix-turn-helix domain-containing protein [Alkalicoccobacillus gibsonii]MBM0064601.1 helix-turn-helix domain-containing protein [Alkalicoccobacillus gibsonii]